MAWIEAEEFYSQIKSQSLNPVVLITGEEPYLIRQCLQQIEAQYVNPDMKDFNFTVYFAGEAEMGQVRDNVETLPTFAPLRVVFLKEAHELSDQDWEELEPLLQNPVSSTLFVMTAIKIDKRKKYFRYLNDAGTCVEFKKLYDNQIPSWIQYIANLEGVQISESANHLMHRLVGSHLLEIESEILKLKDFISPRTRIEVEDVQQVVSKSREESVFQWTEAVASKDRIKAFELLAGLLDQGQSEVGIVVLMARHVRLLLKIKKGQELGYSGPRLAQYVQVPPYFMSGYLKQASLWSVSGLEKVLLTLNETDKALKTSPVSAPLWLENMVLKITPAHV
jgi:DNA polymerase-3 subunit delta